MPNTQREESVTPDTSQRHSKILAIEKAKAKSARLRLMKERNENYLAEQKYEHEAEEELTKELRVSTAE